MKKLITAIVSLSMLLSLLTVCVGAEAPTSKWLHEKGTELVLEEQNIGWSATNTELFSTSLDGYAYLHYTITFEETFHNEVAQNLYFYAMLADHEAQEATDTTANSCIASMFDTKDFVGGTSYDIVVPIESFQPYAAGSINPKLWTGPARFFRFVIAAPASSAAKVTNIYLSVNADDPAPADPASSSNEAQSSNENLPTGEVSKPSGSSTDTGYALPAILATAVIAVSVCAVSSKGKKKN